MKKDDDHCPVCGEYITVTVRLDGFFVDGRFYKALCFCCFTVPKRCDLIGDDWVTFDNWRQDKLHSVSDLKEDGFDQRQATKSLRAVKRCIETAKVTLTGPVVLDTILHGRAHIVDTLQGPGPQA